jgi:hypothetical protein
MAGVSCAGGVCNGACATGYADCNANKQTDGCETETLSNANACGGCSNNCSSNHMQTRTCSAGSCNGSCATGFDDCNNDKLTDGCEADVRYDENNCGACGDPCADGESCVQGTCQTCNDTVLLLGDNNATGVDALRQRLEAGGMVVTVVNPALGSTTTGYQGTPAATDFGAVLVPVGPAYQGMPVAGQNAIATAQAAGTGVVFTELAAYSAQNYWTSLDPLVLFSYGTFHSTTPVTWTLTSSGHPIWDGLSTSFSTSISSHISGTLATGAVSIATMTISGVTYGNAVVVRDNGGGRIVHIAHTAGYSNTTWYNDASLSGLFVNSAKWATGCF